MGRSLDRNRGRRPPRPAGGSNFDRRRLRPAIAATAAIVLFAKPLTAYAVVRLLRRPRRTALTAGLALGQFGEFSFIVATLGSSLGLLPPSAMQILVAVAIVSIAANPIAKIAAAI